MRSKATTPPSAAVVTRTINRFANAVADKAFEGTIPWDSEAAFAEHERIDYELTLATEALKRLIYRSNPE